MVPSRSTIASPTDSSGIIGDQGGIRIIRRIPRRECVILDSPLGARPASGIGVAYTSLVYTPGQVKHRYRDGFSRLRIAKELYWLGHVLRRRIALQCNPSSHSFREHPRARNTTNAAPWNLIKGTRIRW